VTFFSYFKGKKVTTTLIFLSQVTFTVQISLQMITRLTISTFVVTFTTCFKATKLSIFVKSMTLGNRKSLERACKTFISSPSMTFARQNRAASWGMRQLYFSLTQGRTNVTFF